MGPLIFPLASDVSEPITITFGAPYPKLEDAPPGMWLEAARKYWRDEAVRFLDILQTKAPGGFVDAVFAELALRKAGVLRVTNPPKAKPCSCAVRGCPECDPDEPPGLY